MAKRRAYLMEDLNLIGVDYLWQVTTLVSTATTTILICTRSLVRQEIKTMQLLSKLTCRVLSAWNNHRG